MDLKWAFFLMMLGLLTVIVKGLEIFLISSYIDKKMKKDTLNVCEKKA